MDDLAVAAATAAMSEDVDFEQGASLGEKLHPQDGHIHNELLYDERWRAWSQMIFRSEKVTAYTLQRMTRRMSLQHIHIS